MYQLQNDGIGPGSAIGHHISVLVHQFISIRLYVRYLYLYGCKMLYQTLKILSVYDGRAYFNFIESLHSKATKRNYAYGLKHFLIHHQLTDPEQIIIYFP